MGPEAAGGVFSIVFILVERQIVAATVGFVDEITDKRAVG
jgi:hypothetical protein